MLDHDQVRTFRESGVLVTEGVLRPEDLAPVISEYEQWIDGRARALLAAGKITRLRDDLPFDRRLAVLYAQSPEISIGIDIMHVRGEATFKFLRNKRLLDAVESLIGPEITCSPIQHVRAKPPAANSGFGTGFYNVPWHQDAGVTWEEADNSDIITCWIAVVDATVDNGCMEVMPGTWLNGYLEHRAGSGTTIRPDILPNVAPVAVPVRAGGVVFMHRHTPHRSTPNYTDRVRWSMDLRYQPTGTPTGRPFHPDFVVRSASHPESVLTDYQAWCTQWENDLETSRGAKWHRTKPV